MLKRTITGVILVVFVAGFLLCGYFVSSIFVDMLILLFLAGAVFEMFKGLKGAGFKMFVAPPVFLLVTAYPTFYLLQHFAGGASHSASIGVQGLIVVFVVAVMMCLTIFTFKPAKHTQEEVDVAKEQGIELEVDSSKAHELKDLFANIFLLVYPILFMTLSWVLSYKYSAIFVVLFAIFVPTLGADAFAYWFGSMIGGKKLCPKISPKKTIAGAVGGLVGAIIISLVLWMVFEMFADKYPTFIEGCNYIAFISHATNGWEWKTALIYIALGLILGVLSPLGDLAASRIKRAIGIKDYGKIFPGHGGFMDRLDSIMYSLALLLIAFTCIYGY